MLTQSRKSKGASYFSEDTVVALSTAPGGAIGIVRVSGPGTGAISEKLTKQKLRWSEFEPNSAKKSLIFDTKGRPLDETVLLKFANPHSFTGEDVLEIHHHGNFLISERILETAIAYGARQALAGEFSFRAVRNGKLTLPQAEAIADLISAGNEEAARLALEKMSGSQLHAISEISEKLRQLAASGELGIDFSDQDIDELGLARIKEQLKDPVSRLKILAGSFQRGNRLQEGIPTALVGLPNAGKSSFFNALLGEDRSIVSHIAGTTRDVVREKLLLQGADTTLTFRLEDTAGIRKTADEVEKIGIDRTLQSAKRAELVLLIVDATLDEAALDISDLPQSPEHFLGVLTKCDLVKAERIRQKINELIIQTQVQTWLPTSAVSGAGVSEVAEAMVRTARQWVGRKEGEILLTRVEHLDAINHALGHLIRAELAPELDLFAADIRQALHALAPLIGETVADDILGRVFSQFCIGK